ncbi:hypothetical protein [Paludisphaera mucosa]|uniref:Uncharacterized protein n=1 Tax=Paludisphaera mucosa TaxID=3030827 RepID=A0ABT6FES0_9BACT|nr:hypothetical protein [Paludisphaera mucosa]MDG3006078.1 hypothetical protein [Paludisphaera mucosa]
MHLKRIKNGYYLYQSVRAGDRFTSRCLGPVPADLVPRIRDLERERRDEATAAALKASRKVESDAKARDEAERIAKDRARPIRAFGAELDECRREADAAVAAILGVLGYRRHHRGEWRRRRDVESKVGIFIEKGLGPRSEFRELMRFSRLGDDAAEARVAELVATARDRKGDLAELAERSLMEIIPTCVAGGDSRAAVEHYMEGLRRELAPPGSGVVVELLASRAVLDWLHVSAWEQWFNYFSREVSQNAKALKAYQSCFDKAVARYQRSLLAVARARRLSLSVVVAQVNVALEGGRQVNQLKPLGE